MRHRRAHLSNRGQPLHMRHRIAHLLGVPALLNVDTETEIACEFAIGVVTGHPAIVYPAILSIMPAQPVFDLEGLTRIESGFVAFEATLQVVGMHCLCPARAEFGL